MRWTRNDRSRAFLANFDPSAQDWGLNHISLKKQGMSLCVKGSVPSKQASSGVLEGHVSLKI